MKRSTSLLSEHKYKWGSLPVEYHLYHWSTICTLAWSRSAMTCDHFTRVIYQFDLSSANWRWLCRHWKDTICQYIQHWMFWHSTKNQRAKETRCLSWTQHLQSMRFSSGRIVVKKLLFTFDCVRENSCFVWLPFDDDDVRIFWTLTACTWVEHFIKNKYYSTNNIKRYYISLVLLL